MSEIKRRTCSLALWPKRLQKLTWAKIDFVQSNGQPSPGGWRVIEVSAWLAALFSSDFPIRSVKFFRARLRLSQHRGERFHCSTSIWRDVQGHIHIRAFNKRNSPLLMKRLEVGEARKKESSRGSCVPLPTFCSNNTKQFTLTFIEMYQK